MTKEEDKSQKEVEASAVNLDRLLMLLRGEVQHCAEKGRYASFELNYEHFFSRALPNFRSSCDRKVLFESKKKEATMESYWEVVEKSYFKPIKEKDFSELEALYAPCLPPEGDLNDIDFTNLESVRNYFDQYMAQSTTPGDISKTNLKGRESDNQFLHYWLAMKHYYPVLNTNPFVFV
jgi:hypothetical protein